MVKNKKFSKITKRSTSKPITKGDLIEFFHLLELCISAGHDSVGAILAVKDYMPNEKFKEDLKIILRDINLGSSRIEAYITFANSRKELALHRFVRALIVHEFSGSALTYLSRLNGNIIKSLNGEKNIQLTAQKMPENIISKLKFYLTETSKDEKTTKLKSQTLTKDEFIDFLLIFEIFISTGPGIEKAFEYSIPISFNIKFKNDMQSVLDNLYLGKKLEEALVIFANSRKEIAVHRFVRGLLIATKIGGNIPMFIQQLSESLTLDKSLKLTDQKIVLKLD